MKTTGVSGIPKFGLLDFLGHPNWGRYVDAVEPGKGEVTLVSCILPFFQTPDSLKSETGKK